MPSYTGYRINVYTDVNPNSPSFQQTRSERVADTANCSQASSEWQVISVTCELVDGKNSGYVIETSMCVNPDSPDYGQTRVRKFKDEETCPIPNTDPIWVVDDSFEGYCNVIYYEPGHVQGMDGTYIIQLIDENMYSPTNRQTVISAVTDTVTCPMPDTSPQIEEMTVQCEIVDGRMTGYELVTGIDKNVYSPTYLATSTTRRSNPTNCPKQLDCSQFNFVDLEPSYGPTADSVYLATYTLNEGVKLKVLSKPDWVYNVTQWDYQGGKRFIAQFGSNPNLEERVGNIAFIAESGDCTFVATLTQSGATPCSVYNFVGIDTNFTQDGGEKDIATYSASAETPTQGVLDADYPSWITVRKRTSGDSVVYSAVVDRNYSDARMGTVLFKSMDDHCSFTVNISQDAGQGSQCDQYNFTDSGITISASGGDYSAGSCSTGFEDFILVEKPSWITNIEYVIMSGRRSKSIDITADANTASYPRQGKIILKAQEMDCTFTLDFVQNA